MKLKLYVLVGAVMLSTSAFAQDDYNIHTIFNNHGPRSSGGYASISNKFTSINGDYANVVELYGGVGILIIVSLSDWEEPLLQTTYRCRCNIARWKTWTSAMNTFNAD